MITDLTQVLRALLILSLVMSAQIILVLLLRKPVRRYLGSVACYRLWIVTLVWLPAFAIGDTLLRWWGSLNPRSDAALSGDLAGFQLLMNDWVFVPFGKLGNNTNAETSALLDPWAVAAMLWLLGTCAVIAWQTHKYRRFAQAVRDQGQPLMKADAPSAEVHSIFGDALPALTLSGMNSAALFGVRKPVLLLPENFGAYYDSDQQHIILAHERVHLRRHDNAWNLAAGLMVALNWPNPLMHIAWRCFRLDQELSCDALALDSCTNTQRNRYARTLLDAASTDAGFGTQPMLSAWDNLNDLKERTLMIAQHMKNKVSPLVIRCYLSVIALSGAAAMMMLSASFSPATIAAEQTPPANVTQERIGEILRTAIEFLNAKQHAEARAELDELDRATLSPYELSRVEMLYFNLDIVDENFAGARSHMEAAIASGGMNEQDILQGRYQLAQLWIQEEKWAEGAAALEEWINSTNNPNGGVYYLLAAAYYNLDQFDKGIPNAEHAVSLGGDKPQEGWLQLLVAMYLQEEQYSKALPFIRDQVRLFPEKETYQNQLKQVEQILGL